MTDAVVKVYYGNLMMLPDVSRVITCLHEKNVKFDLINMSKERKHTVPFDFLKLQENPSSRVLGPVFDDGSKMLFESREICRYLPENYAEQGNKYLLGTNTLDRASIEQWIRSEKHSFDPPSWNLMFHLAFASLMDLEPKRALIQESEKKLSQLLDVYNQRLADSKFLAGNHFTLADLVHLPNTHYLANSKEWSYLFTSRKNVKKWWKKISQRESWLQTIQRIDQVVNEGRPSLVSSSSKGIVSRKSQVYPAKITELSIDDHISSPSKLKDHQQHFSLHKPETFQSPKKHKRKKKSTKSSKVASPQISHQTEAFKQSNLHFDQLEENPLKRSISPISFGHDPLPIPQSKIISPSNKPNIEIEPSNPHDPPEIPFLEIESPKTEPIVHTQPTDIPTFNPQKSPSPTHKKKNQPKPSGKIATSIPHVHMPNWETYQFYEESMHPESNLPEHLHKTKKNIEDEVSQSHIFYSQKVPPETKYYKLEPTTSSIQHIQKITATPVENTTTEPKLRTKENSNQNPTFPVPLEPGTSYYKKESPKPSQENTENSTRAIHGSDQPQPTKQSQERPSKNSTKETSSKLALFMPTQSEYVPYTKQPTVPHLGKTGIPEGNTLHTMNLKQKSSIPPETQVSVSKPSIDLSSHVQETNTHNQLDEHLKKEFAHTPINPSISVSQPNDFQLSQTKDDLPYPKSEDSQFIQLLDQMDEFNPSRKIHPSIVPQKEDLEPIGPKHETSHQKPPVHVFRRDSFLLTPNDGANQPHFKPASDSYKQTQQVPKDTERLDEYTISSSTTKPSHLPTSQSEPFKQAEKPVEEIHGESVYRQDQTEIPLIQKLFQPLQKVQSSPIDTSPGFPTTAEESMEKNETSTPQSILIGKTQPEIYPMNIKSGSSKDIKGTDEKGEGSKTGKPPTLANQEDRANQPLINDFSQMSHPETLKISEPLIDQDFQNPRLQEPLKETKVMSEATNALRDLPQGVKSVDRKMEEKEATNFLDSTLQYSQKEVNSPSEVSTFLSNQQENPQPVQSFIEKKTSALQKQTIKPSKLNKDSIPVEQDVSKMPKNTLETLPLSKKTQMKTPIQEMHGEAASQQNQAETPLNQERFQPLQRVQISPIATQSGIPKPEEEPLEKKEVSTPQSIIVPSTEAGIDPTDIKSEPSKLKNFYKKEESNTSQPSFLPELDDEPNQFSKPSTEPYMQKQQVQRILKSSADEIISSTIPFPNLESPKQTQTFAEKELSQNKPPTNTQGVPQSIEEVTSLTETQKKSSVHPQNLTGTSSFTTSSLPKDTSSSTKPFLPKDTSSSIKPTLPTPQNEVNQPFKLPIDSSSRTPSLKSNPSNNSQDTKPAQSSTKQIVSQNIFKTSEVALPSQENYPRPLDELERSETKSPKETPLAQNYPKPTPTKTQTDDKPSSINSPSSPQLPPPKKSQSPQPPTGP